MLENEIYLLKVAKNNQKDGKNESKFGFFIQIISLVLALNIMSCVGHSKVRAAQIAEKILSVY